MEELYLEELELWDGGKRNYRFPPRIKIGSFIKKAVSGVIKTATGGILGGGGSGGGGGSIKEQIEKSGGEAVKKGVTVPILIGAGIIALAIIVSVLAKKK